MRNRSVGRWALLVGWSSWYVTAACGMWAGLDPGTILYRSTVAGMCLAGLCWLAGRILRQD
ncbi:MAG: hypothetical protein RMJ19_00115 [Gemmatales bacterium]|nr:hypothetical protein [Gemmatales bacterium]MCS7158850.1 hypothetical protein [Gemmatales bacterium]MDW8174049.1 hypothetical protein [Gemmatales bacterium]MDW8223538.1 hypothetical protein [Gemmatales bacterium]